MSDVGGAGRDRDETIRDQMEAGLRECEAGIREILEAADRLHPQAQQDHAERLNTLLAAKDSLVEKLLELEQACTGSCEGFKAAAVHARLVLQEVFDRAGARFN